MSILISSVLLISTKYDYQNTLASPLFLSFFFHLEIFAQESHEWQDNSVGAWLWSCWHRYPGGRGEKAMAWAKENTPRPWKGGICEGNLEVEKWVCGLNFVCFPHLKSFKFLVKQYKYEIFKIQNSVLFCLENSCKFC